MYISHTHRHIYVCEHIFTYYIKDLGKLIEHNMVKK